jgi:hypothetical protein
MKERVQALQELMTEDKEAYLKAMVGQFQYWLLFHVCLATMSRL